MLPCHLLNSIVLVTFLNFTIPYRIISTNIASEIIYPTSFISLIAHIEPKILWLEIHPANIDRSSYPLKSRHREAGKSFQRNDQIHFPVVPAGKRQQSLFRLQGVDQGCISGSADGRISSKKADTSPGRGKAAFFEWNERREFLFVYSLLSFDSLRRRFPFSLCSNFPRAPFGQLFGSDRQFAWTAQWQLVMAVLLFRIRYRYPLGNDGGASFLISSNERDRPRGSRSVKEM